MIVPTPTSVITRSQLWTQEQTSIEEVLGGLSEFVAQVALKTTTSRGSNVKGQRSPLLGKSKVSITRNFQELRNRDLID